jgi:hypothetical protein
MDVIWTGIVMSLGYGLIFPNTSAAALSCVAPHRIGYAASLFNMLRNTGAAWVIAIAIAPLIPLCLLLPSSKRTGAAAAH